MSSKLGPEEKKYLRDFKSGVLKTYSEKFGTFYIHVIPHPNLEIGKRGLVGEEKEAGIVLVLGPQAVREIFHEQEFLYMELQFGFNWEKLIIPWDALFRVYDKSQNAITQMRVFTDELQFQPPSGKPKEEKKVESKESKVIQVDFSRKDS
ncbi:MAG: stringent starvation protein B [Leptospiraceae bacterium]|nr:stringent starvation protein B [Leptospiraceae bacterium]MCP5502406.1 stringent starvation protein B [Leptospiraceae bacterium]